jgi:hypothetical protein
MQKLRMVSVRNVSRFVALLTLLALISTSHEPSTALAGAITDPVHVAEDAIRFREYTEIGTRSWRVVFGPTSGSLLQEGEQTVLADANVSVTDFVATVSCIAPVEIGRWDCGTAFRDLEGENHFRVWIVSNGSWHVSTGSGAYFRMNDPLGEVILPPHPPGTPIEVTLAVVDGQAYLGVESEYVATIDVSAIPKPGSVSAGVSFTEATHIEGALMAYQDFTVWSLDR